MSLFLGDFSYMAVPESFFHWVIKIITIFRNKYFHEHLSFKCSKKYCFYQILFFSLCNFLCLVHHKYFHWHQYRRDLFRCWIIFCFLNFCRVLSTSLFFSKLLSKWWVWYIGLFFLKYLKSLTRFVLFFVMCSPW